METRQLLIMAFAAVAAGGFAYAFIEPRMTGEVTAEARQKKLAGARVRGGDNLGKTAGRIKQVSETLKEVERKKAANDKVTLHDKIVQAGLDWERQRFMLVSMACAVVMGFVSLIISGNLFVGIGAFIVGGLGLPQWLLIFLRNKRVSAFTTELPNALDVIVRGLRSGLPLGDCIRIIANEAAEPVKTEFRQIVEAQSIGLTIQEAVQGISKRVPTPEANFFSIVIEIQSKAGGNLSEVLSNLSKVLRERKKMKGKVAAMSMEAKASAAIIAALPFIVAILVYISSPDYMSRLWTTEAGKITMVVSGFWMLIGIMSMKKMINFDL
ncbi:MAG TPA: type II secretion system F family protein [Beijerinckiaceae bacterium]|nr:type II secretion system F family protein [Beijerinckiaceae bacterium]